MDWQGQANNRDGSRRFVEATGGLTIKALQLMVNGDNDEIKFEVLNDILADSFTLS